VTFKSCHCSHAGLEWKYDDLDGEVQFGCSPPLMCLKFTFWSSKVVVEERYNETYSRGQAKPTSFISYDQLVKIARNPGCELRFMKYIEIRFFQNFPMVFWSLPKKLAIFSKYKGQFQGSHNFSEPVVHHHDPSAADGSSGKPDIVKPYCSLCMFIISGITFLRWYSGSELQTAFHC
jgi:hypothetical protein